MLYERVADLPLTIESSDLERLEFPVTADWSRVTTVVHLRGAGGEGLGEDVTYQPEPHADPPRPDVAGAWTLDSFSAHLDGFEFFTDEPEDHAARDYRRWAWESAALDLALKQGGTDLARVLDRERSPLTYVVSTRAANVFPLLELYPDLRFKLDPDKEWTDEFIDRLAALGCVDTADFKGVYRGSFGFEPNPRLYKRIADAFPQAWLEDPGLNDETDAVLAPYPRPDHVGRTDPFARRRRGAAVPAALSQRQAVPLRHRQAPVRLLRLVRVARRGDVRRRPVRARRGADADPGARVDLPRAHAERRRAVGLQLAGASARRAALAAPAAESVRRVSFVVVAKWTARAGEEQRVGEAISQLASPTRRERGCLEYFAQRSLDDPHVFLLYEMYESRDAYEAHLASDHFRTYATELGIPLLESRERAFYETFAD